MWIRTSLRASGAREINDLPCRDKRLTRSEGQADAAAAHRAWFSRCGNARILPSFPAWQLQRVQTRRLVARSSDGDPVCPHEYEISVWHSSVGVDCGPRLGR